MTDPLVLMAEGTFGISAFLLALGGATLIADGHLYAGWLLIAVGFYAASACAALRRAGGEP